MPKRAAAIVGLTEWKPERKWPKPMFALEAMAQLAAEVIADAGFAKDEIDGIVFGSVPAPPDPAADPKRLRSRSTAWGRTLACAH